jgi:glutathione peroxidase
MLRFVIACLVATATLAALPASAQTAAAPPTGTACPALLDQTFARLQDEKPQSLCQYSGKVLLVVNTASYCGFTPQYQGLEDLYSRYRERGLVVLGFPSNDFSQETGSNKEIADFCENTFGVKFPNFHKYLVARDGTVVAQYSSITTPQDKAFVAQLEKLLAQR